MRRLHSLLQTAVAGLALIPVAALSVSLASPGRDAFEFYTDKKVTITRWL